MASSTQLITGFPPEASDGKARERPLMTRDDIEVLIAEGNIVFILHGQVIKVNENWVQSHPGGDKALLHFVGKDASDEVDAFHSLDARKQMLRFRIGRYEGCWTNFVPPIQGGVFRTRPEIELARKDEKEEPVSPIESDDSTGPRCRTRTGSDKSSTSPPPHPIEITDGMSYLDSITREYTTLDIEKYPPIDETTQSEIIHKYRDLHQRIWEAGLYQCNYWAYGLESVRYVSLLCLWILCLYEEYYLLGAFFLGAMWHQLTFTAHDAGHMGITHSWDIDTLIGIFIADFMGGLSIFWWKYNHNVHHIVTNAPEHDPDIEHIPFFAISHRLLGNLTSTYYDRVMKVDAVAKVMLRIQAWTYYPILSLARFNLYFQSLDYLIRGRGPKKGSAIRYWWLEVAGQACFWFWFGYIIVYRIIPDNRTRLLFVLISHVTSSPVHLQIVLSHFAMSTTDLGPQESFAQKNPSNDYGCRLP